MIDTLYEQISNIEGWFEKEDILVFTQLKLPDDALIFECGTFHDELPTTLKGRGFRSN